jgi:hypothetical protein
MLEIMDTAGTEQFSKSTGANHPNPEHLLTRTPHSINTVRPTLILLPQIHPS